MKKSKAAFAALVLLVSALVIVLPQSVSAQNSIPPFYDWAGYNGNFTLYDTYFLTDSCPRGSINSAYVLPYNVSGVTEKYDNFCHYRNNNEECGIAIDNYLGISTGGDSAFSTNGKNFTMAEYYSGIGNYMNIYIPVTSIGFSSSTGNLGACCDSVYSQLMETSVSGFSNNSNIKTDIPYGCVAGYNTYGEYDLKQPDLNLVNLTGTFASFLSSSHLPVVSCFADVYSTGVNIYNTINCLRPHYSLTQIGCGFNGDGSLPLNFTITPFNGTRYTYDSGRLSDFNNTFNTQELLKIWIFKQDFGEHGTITLSSRDTWWHNYCCYLNNGSGSYAGSVNISIPVVPANALYGTFYVNNEPSPNQEVKIIQNYNGYCNGEQQVFYVQTNSNGQYRFFAEPGMSYGIQPVLQCGTPNPIVKSIAATNYNSTQQNFYAGNVNFKESGLEPNTQWSVSLGYQTETSTSSEISFLTGNGSYSFTIGSVTGYSTSPSSGTIAVSGKNVAEDIAFASEYTITFSETGLAYSTTWSVDLAGITESSSSSSIIFTVTDGDYSYSVLGVSSYTSSPSSGTITVDSSSVTQDITFTGDYSVTFSESGLPSGTTWEAFLNNTDGYVITTGTSVSLTAGNGQYSYAVPQASERQSNGDIYTYTASPSSGDVTVNGGSTTISVTFKLTSVSSGGGGGGTGCVNATTEVLMANFTYMQAQYVLPGDYVLAYNITTHAYQKEEVLDTYISNHSRLYTINGILQTSAYQPILTNNGYIQVQNLTTKDKIYDAFTGKYVKVTSITLSNGNYTMYDFQIPPDYDFIAWEYVVYDLTKKP